MVASGELVLLAGHLAQILAKICHWAQNLPEDCGGDTYRPHQLVRLAQALSPASAAVNCLVFPARKWAHNDTSFH